jgi:hypothetical protein
MLYHPNGDKHRREAARCGCRCLVRTRRNEHEYLRPCREHNRLDLYVTSLLLAQALAHTSIARIWRFGEATKAHNVGLPLPTISQFVVKGNQVLPRGAAGELGMWADLL